MRHFLYKARNWKHQNAQMEEFLILLIKNLKSRKSYLPKVLRKDLIFQIVSSSDDMSIRNLRNVRLNNCE